MEVILDFLLFAILIIGFGIASYRNEKLLEEIAELKVYKKVMDNLYEIYKKEAEEIDE